MLTIGKRERILPARGPQFGPHFNPANPSLTGPWTEFWFSSLTTVAPLRTNR